jgi:carbon storage regulator
MLVLSRKENEQLIIDDKITVTIIRVSGGTVRLGIDAPAEIPIRRNEFLCHPLDQNQEPLVMGRVG